MVRLTDRHYHHRRHSLHRRPDPDRTRTGQDRTGHDRTLLLAATTASPTTPPPPPPTYYSSIPLHRPPTRPGSVSDKVRRVRRRRRPRYPANRSCLPPRPRRLNGPPCRRPVMELRCRHHQPSSRAHNHRPNHGRHSANSATQLFADSRPTHGRINT